MCVYIEREGNIQTDAKERKRKVKMDAPPENDHCAVCHDRRTRRRRQTSILTPRQGRAAASMLSEMEPGSALLGDAVRGLHKMSTQKVIQCRALKTDLRD